MHGTLKNWLSRQDIEISGAELLSEISEKILSLREAVNAHSQFGGQGFAHCDFLKGKNICNTKRGQIMYLEVPQKQCMRQ